MFLIQCIYSHLQHNIIECMRGVYVLIKHSSLQVGSYDCGLFAIAYITGIAHGIEPARFVFEQSNMRRHLYPRNQT